MFIFPDSENIGNFSKNKILYMEYRDNFEVFKIKGCTSIVVECSYTLLPFEWNFELGAT